MKLSLGILVVMVVFLSVTDVAMAKGFNKGRNKLRTTGNTILIVGQTAELGNKLSTLKKAGPKESKDPNIMKYAIIGGLAFVFLCCCCCICACLTKYYEGDDESEVSQDSQDEEGKQDHQIV